MQYRVAQIGHQPYWPMILHLIIIVLQLNLVNGNGSLTPICSL